MRELRRVLHGSLVLCLLLGLPAAWVLPVAVAWENGWLENLQLALLLAAAAVAWRFARAHRGADAALARAVTPLWLILAARECSWGASVLTDPVDTLWWGPVYSSSMLFYKPVVYPLVAAVLLACVVSVAWGRVWPLLEELVASTPFVWAELTLVLVSLLMAAYAEGHVPGLPLPATLGHGALVLEEWLESVAYVALVVAQWHLFALMRARTLQPAAAKQLP